MEGNNWHSAPSPFQAIDSSGGIGALGAIRTPDPQIRSLMLYPAELRALTETTIFALHNRASRGAKRGLEHAVAVGRMLGDKLQDIPVLDDLAGLVHAKDIHARPDFAARPLLPAMGD